jgi:hypothetical protein
MTRSRRIEFEKGDRYIKVLAQLEFGMASRGFKRMTKANNVFKLRPQPHEKPLMA